MKLFSEAEIGIIRNLILTRSHKQIADFLDCATEDINLKVDELQKENFVITYQMKLDEKASKRTKRPKAVQHLKEKQVEKRKVELENITTRAIRHNNNYIKETFGRSRVVEIKTKVIDYTKMKSVRVDEKTTIFINENESADEAIKKYRRNQEQADHLKLKHGN